MFTSSLRSAIRRPAVGAAAVLLLSACGGDRQPPALDDIAWQKELEAQFTGLGKLRTGPAGPLSWVGLWLLPEGSTTLGSGPSATIRLAAPGVPPLAGTFVHAGADVLVESAPKVALALEDGTPVSGALKLESDATSRPTVLAFGDVKLKVHEEPGTTRRWVRAWSASAPAMLEYKAPARYPLSRDFRLAAKLTPSSTGQPIDLEDVTGGTQQFALAGELAFTVRGEKVRMLAFKREGRDSLFVVFRDSTSGNGSYAAARYVYVPAPDKERWTVLDFNKAHNPPCAFTTFSTCVLPPKQNRLTVAILAGEMAPAGARIGEGASP